MKIIQFQYVPGGVDTFASLFALADTGDLFWLYLDDTEENRWTRLVLPIFEEQKTPTIEQGGGLKNAV